MLERLLNSELRAKLNEYNHAERRVEQLENIIKYILTDNIGSLKCGMTVESKAIDKLKDLKLSIDFLPEFNQYLIKVSF